MSGLTSENFFSNVCPCPHTKNRHLANRLAGKRKPAWAERTGHKNGGNRSTADSRTVTAIIDDTSTPPRRQRTSERKPYIPVQPRRR
jgi:hypothetical protein